jgi:hypothetical protein
MNFKLQATLGGGLKEGRRSGVAQRSTTLALCPHSILNKTSLFCCWQTSLFLTSKQRCRLLGTRMFGNKETRLLDVSDKDVRNKKTPVLDVADKVVWNKKITMLVVGNMIVWNKDAGCRRQGCLGQGNNAVWCWKHGCFETRKQGCSLFCFLFETRKQDCLMFANKIFKKWTCSVTFSIPCCSAAIDASSGFQSLVACLYSMKKGSIAYLIVLLVLVGGGQRKEWPHAWRKELKMNYTETSTLFERYNKIDDDCWRKMKRKAVWRSLCRKIEKSPQHCSWHHILVDNGMKRVGFGRFDHFKNNCSGKRKRKGMGMNFFPRARKKEPTAHSRGVRTNHQQD